MLPKLNKLSPFELTFVLQEGRLVKGRLVSLKAVELNDGRPIRFGQIVSKNISPLAVRRNQLKRALKMGFLKKKDDLPVGWLVVALPSREAGRAEKKLVIKEMEEVLNQTFKIKNEKG